MVERCALSGSDLKIKFRTILLTSIIINQLNYVLNYFCFIFFLLSLHGV